MASGFGLTGSAGRRAWAGVGGGLGEDGCAHVRPPPPSTQPGPATGRGVPCVPRRRAHGPPTAPCPAGATPCGPTSPRQAAGVGRGQRRAAEATVRPRAPRRRTLADSLPCPSPSLQCVATTDDPRKCQAKRDDYLECLHHRKEARYRAAKGGGPGRALTCPPLVPRSDVPAAGAAGLNAAPTPTRIVHSAQRHLPGAAAPAEGRRGRAQGRRNWRAVRAGGAAGKPVSSHPTPAL